jgi:hypothetical protein
MCPERNPDILSSRSHWRLRLKAKHELRNAWNAGADAAIAAELSYVERSLQWLVGLLALGARITTIKSLSRGACRVSSSGGLLATPELRDSWRQLEWGASSAQAVAVTHVGRYLN